jgi:hypothetical protein
MLTTVHASNENVVESKPAQPATPTGRINLANNGAHLRRLGEERHRLEEVLSRRGLRNTVWGE